jgi:hypothetical protein
VTVSQLTQRWGGFQPLAFDSTDHKSFIDGVLFQRTPMTDLSSFDLRASFAPNSARNQPAILAPFFARNTGSSLPSLNGQTMESLGKLIIYGGVALVVIGVLVMLLGRNGGSFLPGDIVVERKNVRFYFPVVTCLLVSLVLSLIAWLVRR